MGKPKKRTTPRETGNRRSHHLLKLARTVNAKSPVKVKTTTRETGRGRRETTKTAKTASAASK